VELAEPLMVVVDWVQVGQSSLVHQLAARLSLDKLE
jgi:hypothetical protein